MTENVKKHLIKEIARSEAAIEAHIDRLKKNPSDAMEFADEAFSSVARKSVMTTALNHLNKSTLEGLRMVAMTLALRGSRWPSRSTSASSNILAQETASVWAELLELLEDAIEV